MFFYLAIIFLAVLESNGQESCLTPTSNPGNCINIADCPVLTNLFNMPRPLPAESINTLRRSQCGEVSRTVKVCCPLSNEPSRDGPTPDLTQQPPDVTNHPNLRFLDYNTCGPSTQERIVGGKRTRIFEFPWMALISYNVNVSNVEFGCGGTLISERYVLTAAHCVTKLASNTILRGVRLGEHDLRTERDCLIVDIGEEPVCAEKYEEFSIESVQVHAGFSIEKRHNDIALIRLNKNVDFRNSVRPICLPIGSATTLSQNKLIVTGWGTTETRSRSQVLLQAALPIVSQDNCVQAYKRRQYEIWYKQLCAGGVNRTDSCTGDSGGPVQGPVFYSYQVKYFQYGIVSFGALSCGTEGLPTVYTSVLHYMDWILDHMTD